MNMCEWMSRRIPCLCGYVYLCPYMHAYVCMLVGLCVRMCMSLSVHMVHAMRACQCVCVSVYVCMCAHMIGCSHPTLVEVWKESACELQNEMPMLVINASVAWNQPGRRDYGKIRLHIYTCLW